MKRDEPPSVTDSMLEIVELPTPTTIRPGTSIRSRPGEADPTAGTATDDPEAVIVLAFDRYAERLKAFASAAVRDDAAADDLVQETFLRYVREVRAGKRPENVGGWLHRVCANLIVSRGRRRTVAQRYLGRLLDRGHAASPEDLVIGRDGDRRTLDALERLAPEARVALLMAAQGHDSRSIGDALGKSPEAARTYLCRSRMRLREILAEDEP